MTDWAKLTALIGQAHMWPEILTDAPNCPSLEGREKQGPRGILATTTPTLLRRKQNESSGLGPYLLTPPFGEEQHQVKRQPPFDSRVRFLRCLYSPGRIAAFDLLAVSVVVDTIASFA